MFSHFCYENNDFIKNKEHLGTPSSSPLLLLPPPLFFLPPFVRLFLYSTFYNLFIMIIYLLIFLFYFFFKTYLFIYLFISSVCFFILHSLTDLLKSFTIPVRSFLSSFVFLSEKVSCHFKTLLCLSFFAKNNFSFLHLN